MTGPRSHRMVGPSTVAGAERYILGFCCAKNERAEFKGRGPMPLKNQLSNGPQDRADTTTDLSRQSPQSRWAKGPEILEQY